MTPRPDVSEERKSQILEAAAAVSARVDFRTTRIDDIAEQAGLSKGALDLYYKSKDAIITALLTYFFAQEFKRVQGFVESDREVPVAEQLMILTRQLTQAMQWMSRLRHRCGCYCKGCNNHPLHGWQWQGCLLR